MGRHVTAWMLAVAVTVLMGGGADSAAQQIAGPELGKKTYQMFCIICHGPTGGGSPLGSALTSVESKVKSDSDLIRLIAEGGGSGSLMSAYETGLSRDEIFWTMIYIRELQGESRVRSSETDQPKFPDRPVVSDKARRGEKLFNDKASCIQCHTYYTRGGILASDLSLIAQRLTADEIQTAVLEPNAEINPAYGTKQIILHDGGKMEGRFRMETINTIQIANEDATLWRTVFKKDIRKIRDGKRSLMPKDYGERLNETERAELFSFLDTLK